MKQSGIVQFAFLNPSWPRPRSSVCLMCVIGRKHTGDFFCVCVNEMFRWVLILLRAACNICSSNGLHQNPPVCLLSAWEFTYLSQLLQKQTSKRAVAPVSAVMCWDRSVKNTSIRSWKEGKAPNGKGRKDGDPLHQRDVTSGRKLWVRWLAKKSSQLKCGSVRQAGSNVKSKKVAVNWKYHKNLAFLSEPLMCGFPSSLRRGLKAERSNNGRPAHHQISSGFWLKGSCDTQLYFSSKSLRWISYV